jgi:LacI family transcriptional regulator
MPADPLPKYLEIARLIESQVASRTQAGAKVPSARTVASAHGVSLVTASRALQVLRDKGLIRVVDRSGNYRTELESGSAVQERWTLVLRSTPGPWFMASVSFMQSGFAAAAQREGARLEVDHFELDEPKRAADFRRQADRAVEAGISGIFMMPSRVSAEAARQDEVFLRCCREAGLGVVLIERNLRGLGRALEHDLVAADDFDGGLQCTQHLLDRGRRKVAFVTGSPTSSHEARLAGYLTAYQRAGLAWGPLVLEQPARESSKEAYEQLADRLLAEGADGVVCYQDYTALGLILELLTRGTRVPRDVAMTGFDNLPIGKAFAIGVTTYAFSSETLARMAIRTMRARLQDPSAPPVKLLVPGTLIVRESSDPS